MDARQRKFIDEYLIDFNASRAARDAGYSKKTARQQGSRLLTNVDVAAEVKERTEMSPAEVRARLTDIARGDITDLLDIGEDNVRFRLVDVDAEGNQTPNPKAKLIKKITKRTSRTVSPKGGETESTSFEIELYAADSALVKIGEMHGLFRQRVSHENPDGSPVEPPKIVNIYIPDNGRTRTA